MQSIKKLTDKVANNVSTIAGSALLVGATLTGGAAFAAAQSGSSGNSMDLGDYPQPFVTEDGQVQTSIVLGSDAKVTDVVGATEIAGSLGNAAFKQETKSVSVSGAGGSWSASNGVTLDTANDNLYFGDSLDTVRDTLTSEQLSSLKDTTFQDDNGDETDIENYLYPGSLQTTFGKPDDRNNQDPIHYVSNPADPTSNNNLFTLQANFEDEIDFAADDVEDEEIQLFGNTYTVSTDTTSGELVLYGSQDTTSVASGKSTTITINGNEHTFEVVGVTGKNTAAFKVDGELQQKDEEDTITVDGTEVRLSDVIQTNADQSQGTVTFAIGNNELVLKEGEAIEDGDGNDIDGTKVNFQGLDAQDDNNDDSNEADDSEEMAASGIEIYVGAQNDDHEYIQAGNSYSHELFPEFTFRYGGLAPDASNADSENVHQVEFSTSGDDTVTVGMTADGSSTSLEALHNPDPASDNSYLLGDDDGDQYVVKEGASVYEDEYVAADAGDFAHIWEVTNIDRDTAGTNLSAGDEAVVTLQDAVTGDTVEVDVDAANPTANAANADEDYTGTEVIDGQTYHITVDGTADDASTNGREGYGVRMAYGGASATVVNDGPDTLDTGDATSLYAPVDTASGSAIALTEEITGLSNNTVVELPSTESTDAKTHNVSLADGKVNEFTVGQTLYQAENTAGAGGVKVSVDPDQSTDTNYDPANAGVLTVLPEDDNDNEESYFVGAGYDGQDDQITVNNADYSGAMNNRQSSTLESNNDVTAYVDYYGAYSEFDSDEQKSFTLNIPAGQSTVGAAFTTQAGSLSSEGGGSGSVQTQMPTWQRADGVLADDGNVGQVKQNENVILVGGPAANSLTQELVADNQTMPASEYTQGQGMIQLVDGFSEGHQALVVAGYSGKDTRAAAEFLANYRNNQDALEGKEKVTISTSTGSVVN
ncbi:MAG: S-layer protein [Candidatus Nanohalobium sp.]